MKITYAFFLILLILPSVWAADPVSIEDFKKMNPLERDQVILHASPEEKKVLLKINLHLNLLQHFGGEAGLRQKIESMVASGRGVGGIEDVFDYYAEVWDQYAGDVLMADQKADMAQKQLEEVGLKLHNEREDVNKLQATVHALVFNMAASPKALELEKKRNR